MLRDLGIGARFALAGGRNGVLRTLMTALGVGIGVALLLLAVSIPGTLAHQRERVAARQAGDPVPAAASDTLLYVGVPTAFHGADIVGVLLRPDGPDSPVPPGLTRLPAAGEAFVSPALRDLLADPGSQLLRERLPYRIGGTIGAAGLSGPTELAYYAGSADLVLGHETTRIASFGVPGMYESFDPVLLLLVIVIFVVLLLPIGVFVAAAVRFGAEQRDRRLAALRLIGADRTTVRRIAAGEALAAALLGLLAGTGFFLLGRLVAERVPLERFTVFAGDIRPGAGWVLLVAVAVPALAVLVTMVGLRGVVIEPLGVLRQVRRQRGGLWWRLLLPGAGLTLLLPLIDHVDRDAATTPYSVPRVAAGLVLLLVSVATLVPWLVEAAVSRIRPGGPVPWQLAIRRLQMQSGSPARVVNGIAVAVAGAIALQMLFTGVETRYVQPSGVDVQRANVTAAVDPAKATAVRTALAAVPGVSGVVTVLQDFGSISADAAGQDGVNVRVGDCAALATFATLSSCHDGDVFEVPRGGETIPPGSSVSFGEPAVSWRVPSSMRPVSIATNGTGMPFSGLLITSSAFPAALRAGQPVTVYLRADETDPDTVEQVRTAFGRLVPTVTVSELSATDTTDRFLSVRRGLLAGTVITLLLIGFSLLVGVLEQLRENRRVLAVLTAFGTPHRVLGWSVLWQTAVPVALGLLLAVPSGIGLGALLLHMVRAEARIDPAGVLTMTGIAAAVVLLVTAASLPALRRIMRADGLRTE